MFWLLLVASYIIGSFPSALIIGRVFHDVDIREHGSKNPGATNTLLVLGKKSGIVVLLIDSGKGAFAASLPLLLHLNYEPLYFGLAAVFGHCFPIFAGFRGGKAIATTAGALIISDITLFIVAYLSFFFVSIVTKYIFYGSISVGLSMFIYDYFSPRMKFENIFLLFFFLLIYLHRSNIRNFILGVEPKITDRYLLNDPNLPKNKIKI